MMDLLGIYSRICKRRK